MCVLDYVNEERTQSAVVAKGVLEILEAKHADELAPSGVVGLWNCEERSGHTLTENTPVMLDPLAHRWRPAVHENVGEQEAISLPAPVFVEFKLVVFGDECWMARDEIKTVR
jgi:hypothetical protein